MANLNTSVVTAVTVTGTTETTLVTSSPGVNQAQPSYEGMKISGVVNVTPGTSTTAVVIRVRQGSGTGGSLVGVAQTHTLAAGNSANIAYEVLDTAGNSGAGLLWTVTCQQTAAAANGTANIATITTTLATALP